MKEFAAIAHGRFWHEPEEPVPLAHVRYGGKAEIQVLDLRLPLLTQAV